MLRTALAAMCLTLTLGTVSGAAAQPGAGRATLRVSVAGGGKILSSDGRIDCGSRCSASYRQGAIRRLTASPREGFEFEKWGGDCIGTAPICDVALDRPQRTIAAFVGKPMRLSVSVGGPGRIISTRPAIVCGGSNGICDGVVPYGTTVTLTPQPAVVTGRFAGWEGPCAAAGTSSCTLNVRGPVGVAATFAHTSPVPGELLLGVVINGHAHVTSQPFGIDCLPTCDASFPSGTLVTLTLDSGSQWIGGCWGFLARCRLVLDASTAVTVATPPPPPLPLAPAIPPRPPVDYVDTTVSGKGLVTGPRLRCGRAPTPRLGCHDWLPRGHTYVLHAVRRKRTRFARWGGDCRGRKPTCRIKVPSGGSASFEVTALFRSAR